MRLRRLTLDSYGAFDGRSIEIGPGLTVVHGPNQSGKTTLAHAVGDLLWGLNARSHPYAFRVSGSQLRLTAAVTRCEVDCPAEGGAEELTLTVTSRGCQDIDHLPVDPWWRGGPVGTREAWRRAFGMDRDGLREGGRQVLADGGDLADRAVPRPHRDRPRGSPRERLLEQADKIYKRHGGNRSVTVRVAEAEVDTTRTELDAVMSSGAAVARLREERDTAQKVVR